MKRLVRAMVLASVAFACLVMTANVASATVDDYVYASSIYGSELYVANADDLSGVGNITGLGEILSVKSSPDGKWVAVVNKSESTYQYYLSFVNTSSVNVERTIKSSYVYDLAFSGDSSRLYLLTLDKVLIYNPANGYKLGEISLKYPKDDESLIALSPDGNRVYVVTGHVQGSSMYYNDYNITAYDAHSHDYLGALRLNTTVRGIAVSPDGSTIYATTSYLNPADNLKSTNNLVFIINAASLNAAGAIGVGQNPSSIVFSRDGKKAYVGNEDDGSVSIIDTASRKVIKTVTVPGLPRNLIAAYDGKKIYVPGYESGLAIIDTASDTVKVSKISGIDVVSLVAIGRVSSGLLIGSGFITPGHINPGLSNLSAPTPTAAPTATPENTTVTATPTAAPPATPTATATPASPSSVFLAPLAAGVALLMLVASGRFKR